MRSMVFRDSRRTPSTSPPLETTDWIRASERAFACRSRRRCRPAANPVPHDVEALHRTGEGLEGHRFRVDLRGVRLVGSSVLGGRGGGRWHVHGHAVELGGIETDVEVRPQRAGDLVRDEVAESLAGDAPDHLTDEVAVRHRVIAGRGPRLPPRRLRGEQGGGPVPVVQVLHREGVLPAGQPARVREQVPHLDRPPCRSRRTRASTAPPARARRAPRGRRARAPPGPSPSSWSTRRR